MSDSVRAQERVPGMMDYEITLLFNEYKYRDLAKALKSRGSTIQLEMERALDVLYTHSVPLSDQVSVKGIIEMFEELDRDEKAASRCFTAIQIAEEKSVRHLESDVILSPAVMGKLCHGYLAAKASNEIEGTLAGGLPAMRVAEATFKNAVSSFTRSDNIIGVYKIDLNQSTFSILNEDRDWVLYPLDIVTMAAHRAFSDYPVFLEQAIDAFRQQLSGNEIATSQEEAGQTLGC